MTDIAALQNEITRWENDLAALEDECLAEGWTEPEKLLMTLQRTSGTYRHRVLPRLQAEGALLLPAIPDNEAPAALAAYNQIIIDELSELVGRLDELRLELIRFGQATQLQIQATEILAALRALGRVVLRFGQNVELPSLTARLTPEQSDQLTDAVHSYERSLR
ncbi:hypothetical protein GCM10009554_08560 [Kribbella koreensis]|jgi:hypothetical protein|uniref:DUF4254 domain-containing protein n=2 Tax=Kribbella TaxID=182639 RepID=A0ABP6YW78_9ACTN